MAKDVPLITCLDGSFKHGNIDMDALKKALRNNKIEVENNELLMPKLGYFFKCYSDPEGAIEIIVPNEMAGYIAMAAYKQCIMRNYQVVNCIEINQ